MPTPIDSLAHVLGNIALARNPTLRARSPRQSGARERSSQEPRPELEQVVSEQIARIEGDDPEFRRKAVRAFVESVLVHRLGPHWINQPDLYQLVDEVQSVMERDPSIAAQMDALLQHLRKRA
jgi:hypothetical protein